MGRLGAGLQEVALGPDRHLGGHDDLFADGVDRRVGDLGEELLEVRVEQLRPFREHCQCLVVAHGADRLGTRGGHRVDQESDVLGGVAEDLLAAQDGLVIGLDDARRGRQFGQLDKPLAEPLLVGVLGGDAVLELVVRNDALLGGVDQEHASRLQPTFGHDLVRGDIQHAGLGSHDDAAVGGDVVAGRAQTVAIQCRPDPNAVRKRDRRGPVPRLHQTGVKLVEGLLVGRHRLVVLPRLGDHHHQSVCQRPPGEVEQLEGVVQDRGV